MPGPTTTSFTVRERRSISTIPSTAPLSRSVPTRTLPTRTSSRRESTRRTGGNGLAPYFNFAESFNPAAGHEVDAVGNILDPRRGEQFEVGMKFQPDGTNNLYTISIFDITETNRALPGALPNTYTASGEISIRGMELEAIHRIGDFSLQAGYTLLNTRDFSTPAGLQLESVPEQEASAWLM